jgi:hypothetical protein
MVDLIALIRCSIHSLVIPVLKIVAVGASKNLYTLKTDKVDTGLCF